MGATVDPNNPLESWYYDPDDIVAEAVNSAVPSTGGGVGHTNEEEPQNSERPTQPTNRRSHLFGLPRRKGTVYSELKYPEDPHGEETGPTARVWRTYLQEAEKADAELMEGWKDTTDVSLVFAGLFSAVVATFVVQTSTALQPDYAQITASLLFEQSLLLRATANHTSLDTIPPSPLNPDSNFPISAIDSDRWVNGLWFASLSVSLAAALMAVLVKQWMQCLERPMSKCKSGSFASSEWRVGVCP